MNPIALRLILIVAGLGSSFWAGWEWRDRSADLAESQAQTAQANAAVQQTNQARNVERATATDLAAIGAKHENDRTAAAAVPDAVVADLRAGNLRLRDGWASCETQRLSDAAASAGQRNAAADGREQFAGAVVRVGRDADDQLRACQVTVTLYQQRINGATIAPATTQPAN